MTEFQPEAYPILDRAILDTTGEYPVVYSAVYVPEAPQPLTVARIDLTQPGDDIPVTRPTDSASTAFTLTHDGVVPQQLTVNATTHGADAHGFAVIGLTSIGTQLPSWPVTMGEVPDGGVWLMVACPADTTLAYIDGPIGGRPVSTELDQLRRQNHDLHMRLDAVRRDRDRLYEEVLDLSATVAMLRRKYEGHTGHCGAVLYATATERIECALPRGHRGAHRSPGRIWSWPARPDAEARTEED